MADKKDLKAGVEIGKDEITEKQAAKVEAKTEKVEEKVEKVANQTGERVNIIGEIKPPETKEDVKAWFEKMQKIEDKLDALLAKNSDPKKEEPISSTPAPAATTPQVKTSWLDYKVF